MVRLTLCVAMVWVGLLASAASGVLESGRIGLRPRSGADGVTDSVELGGRTALAARPGSMYLYFDADASRLGDLASGVFVVAEYFDARFSGALSLQYDSTGGEGTARAYRPAEARRGGQRLGGERWSTVVFRLEHPAFAGRQNLGADLRFHGEGLALGAVRIATGTPPEWETAAADATHAQPRVRIGPGGQLIIGGFDPSSRKDAVQHLAYLEAELPVERALGATSHETYVRWNLCEPEEGRYDWSIYDAYVETLQRYDMKWVPFLIVGSAYSLPDWYYGSSERQGYVCLEHGEACDVESLWNPALRGHVARFIRAFCEHYRDTGVIEGILLGITGNYGEAIYVASGNDWTAGTHGQYHTHHGYWAGDRYAVADFRRFLRDKYKTNAALQSAWRSTSTLDSVGPFLPKNAPSDRAWLDFCDWYTGSMNDWARFWMSETRRHFPKGDIYLCTGGDAVPWHGSNFAEQCKLAAEVGGGVRITNEASDYAQNFTLTRWVASAGRQYGAYFSFEPAGAVDATGVIARIYNAAASGARGLHYYYPNLGSQPSRENFLRWGGEFRQYDPVVEIAVYYPETWVRQNGKSMLGRLRPLRDCFDFAFMSDRQILDGGLSGFPALVLVAGATAEAAVWDAVAEWVRSGGVLLAPGDLLPLRTVEGEARSLAETGEGRVLVYEGGDGRGYRRFVTERLRELPGLSPATTAMLAKDGREDGRFATAVSPDELLWLPGAGSEIGHEPVRSP